MLRRAIQRIKCLGERPFATALGFLLVSSMLIQMLGLSLTADVLKSLVPGWLLLILSLTYGLAGIFLLVGLMWRRQDYEAAGCILIFSGLMIRMMALLIVLGITSGTLSNAIFYLGFGWACIERLRQIVNGDRIIRVHQEIIFKDNS